MDIKNGYLDLSYYNFNKNGLFVLAGEWKINRVEDSKRFTSIEYNDNEWNKFVVPGSWEKPMGFCWLRLKIDFKENENLMLCIWDVLSAYEIYINGKIIKKIGETGTDKLSSIPKREPVIMNLPPDKTIQIAWKISNYYHGAAGGPVFSPIIGTVDQIQKYLFYYNILDSMVLGIIIIMILFHFLLWLHRKKEKNNLYFCLICIIVFIRMLSTNYFLERIFNFNSIYYFRLFLEFQTIILSAFIFSLFFHSLYPLPFSKKYLLILFIVCIIESLFIIITPIQIWSQFMLFFQATLMIAGIFILLAILNGILEKKENAKIVFFATLLLYSTAIYDIIISNLIISDFYLAQIGLVVFSIIQSVLLSVKFSKAVTLSEHLTKELENKVMKRTHELRQAKNEIEKQSQEKNRFYQILSHEIKTPLTLIKNYFETYIHFDLKGKIPEKLKLLKYHIDSFTIDMNNLLDSEMIEKGHFLYDNNFIINVSNILYLLTKLYNPTAKRKKIDFILNNSHGALYIKINPQGLNRVINNLFSNALKYADSKIIVSVKAEKETISVLIMDDGPGIPSDMQENIFLPYSQGEKSGEGLGLGLYIVKHIINSINDMITLESKPGQTVFTLTFKRHYLKEGETVESFIPSQVENRLPDIRPVKEEYDKNKKTIFFVEDHLELIRLLQDSVNSEFNLFYAINGLDAIQKIETIPKPDIIICDVMMPEMTGHEFFEKLQTITKYRDIPFIFTTARTFENEKRQAIRKGAIDYIYKPFSIETLKEKIKTLLKQKEKQINVLTGKMADFLRNDEDTKLLKFEKLCNKHKISTTERKVLKLFLQGLEQKEIAATMYISEYTVKNHLRHIYKKCHLHNRVAIVRYFSDI